MHHQQNINNRQLHVIQITTNLARRRVIQFWKFCGLSQTDVN